MIKALIFSKDRPLQLRTLLESIAVNAPEVFDITILYKASNSKYEAGYNALQKYDKIIPANWVMEEDFKKQTLEFLNHTEDYTCFFTDDDMIYRPVVEEEITSQLKSDPEVFCFSLRLGKNTTYCYMMRCDNVIIPLEENDKYIKWDWSVHYADFGYPLSVDGHVFRAKDILKLVSKVSFTNPNNLESSLQVFDNFPKNKMVSFKHSVLVNNPINMVQNEYTNNRQGEQHGISPEELVDKYVLNGEVIDFKAIDFSNITGCHQELPITYKKHEYATQN